MLRQAALVGLATLVVISGLVTTVPQQTKAIGGTITLGPGQWFNITVGYFEVDQLILWNVFVTGRSPNYTDWLEKPDGTHVALSPERWGVVTDQAGFWMMRFTVDENGTSSTTVDYVVDGVVPGISVVSPSNGSYVTELPFNVIGRVDSWASSVRVSLDNGSYSSVSIYSESWTWILPSGLVGQHTLYAEETISWGSLSTRFNDSVTFTVDNTHPSLVILFPAISDVTYLKDLVNISWQCSDDIGIAKREVNIDASGWQNVATDAYVARFPDGNHSVAVRVTDFAGNDASGLVSFVCDTTAPLVKVTKPDMDSRIDRDYVVVLWAGSDNLSGIDHYEVRITGGQWINVGEATSYEFTGLGDGWHSVDVRAVDRSGNFAASTSGFGIFTSIWSPDGPYHGILLYVLIAVAIIIVLVVYALAQRRTESDEPPDDEP